MDIEQYEKLVKEFKSIPLLPATPPTFMEVAGYPHYENVCSNILCFYIDTKQQHQLGNLLLKSLFECLAEKQLAENIKDTTDVYREEATVNKKRIDIVIEADDTVIAIENKIFHLLNNKLDEYKSHIENKLSSYKNKLFVVLSVRPEIEVGHSFVNVTYKDFFEKIKLNLGNYITNGDTKYITFLIDFIASIQNLYKPINMNLEMFNFLADNYQDVEEIQKEYKSLCTQLYKVVNNLSDNIPSKGTNVAKWIYQRWVLVHDFTFDNNVVITVDCSINFKKTIVSVLIREGTADSQLYLKKLVLFSDKDILNFTDNRVVIFEKDIPFFDINIIELTAELNIILDKIKIKA